VRVKENLTPDSERLFGREATLLATLRHRNLPRVTNHFVLANEQYLVMDYVEGEDLKQRLERQGALPERLVRQWAEQLCDALSYLHGLNPPIIHRDIKPANIKLTPGGEIMLVDFGVARPTTPGDQKTATNTLAYTPGFTPPEQYGLGRTDARADQYALAATLYTLLTAQAPPDSVERLLGNVTLIPPHALRPELSPGLVAAIVRALAVQPEDRYPTIAAFRVALLSGPPPADAEATMMRPAAGAPAPTPSKLGPAGPPPTTMIPPAGATVIRPPAGRRRPRRWCRRARPCCGPRPRLARRPAPRRQRYMSARLNRPPTPPRIRPRHHLRRLCTSQCCHPRPGPCPMRPRSPPRPRSAPGRAGSCRWPWAAASWCWRQWRWPAAARWGCTSPTRPPPQPNSGGAHPGGHRARCGGRDRTSPPALTAELETSATPEAPPLTPCRRLTRSRPAHAHRRAE
jgi:hypothetical protein